MAILDDASATAGSRFGVNAPSPLYLELLRAELWKRIDREIGRVLVRGVLKRILYPWLVKILGERPT